MPTFDEVAESAAPPEAVWKLLYDPEQFERWWGCFEAGDVPQSHPTFPLPQVVTSDRGDGRIVVSCLVRDIAFEWQLKERTDGGTRIELRLTVPDSYGFRVESQRNLIAFSLGTLARLAEELAPA